MSRSIMPIFNANRTLALAMTGPHEMGEVISTALAFIKRRIRREASTRYRSCLLASGRGFSGHRHLIQDLLGDDTDAIIIHNELSQWASTGDVAIPRASTGLPGYKLEEAWWCITHELGLVELDELADEDHQANLNELLKQLEDDVWHEAEEKVKTLAISLSLMGVGDHVFEQDQRMAAFRALPFSCE